MITIITITTINITTMATIIIIAILTAWLISALPHGGHARCVSVVLKHAHLRVTNLSSLFVTRPDHTT